MFYDMSPVFDPDLTSYYLTVPGEMTGEVFFIPRLYDENVYGMRYTAYRKDAAGNETLDSAIGVDLNEGDSIVVPELLEGESYRLEIEVRRTDDLVNLYGSTTYYVTIYKNAMNERLSTLTNNLKERNEFSPILEIQVNGEEVSRDVSQHTSDRAYYLNTVRSSNKTMTLAVPSYLVSAGARLYMTNMATYDSETNEHTWIELPWSASGLNGSGYTLNLTANNDNWYVFMLVDANGNRFYNSLAIYKDLDGKTDTHLYNLAVSDPTVPLYRENVQDYFVAVEDGTTLAQLIARSQQSGEYLTELRIRTVGGEYLIEVPELARTEDFESYGNFGIPLHPGSNRVTITVKTVQTKAGDNGGNQITHKRAYQVELYVAYPTGSYTDTSAPDHDYLPAGDSEPHTEGRSDTADIIWMDHTAGGNLAPVWNSELVNYFLSYPMFSQQLVTDADGKPVLSSGKYVYVANDTLIFRPILRPEEEERASVRVQRYTVDPFSGVARVDSETGTKLTMDPVTHTWDYAVNRLPAGETNLLFLVEVEADDGEITRKEYRITIWRDSTDMVEKEPHFAKGTALEIRSVVNGVAYETTPIFDPERNFYYVNLPYEAEEAQILADLSYPVVYEDRPATPPRVTGWGIMCTRLWIPTE